jgi:hypothetical protein
VGQKSRRTKLSGQELERRLVEDPASMGVKDLAVVNGIALDKIAKCESWARSTHDAAGLAAQSRTKTISG